MLSLDRFLPRLSLEFGPRAGRTGLDWILCVGDADIKSGDMVVREVSGDSWLAESNDTVVGAVDGEAAKPVSRRSPTVSHIDGSGCAEEPGRVVEGLAVWKS